MSFSLHHGDHLASAIRSQHFKNHLAEPSHVAVRLVTEGVFHGSIRPVFSTAVCMEMLLQLKDKKCQVNLMEERDERGDVQRLPE